jgi:isocitrate dehydrogenase (NAD+)
VTEVTLVPGTGVGPAVASALQEVLAALGAPIRWDMQPELEGAIASTRRTGIAVKGKWAWTPTPGVLPPSVRFRRALGVDTIVRRVATIDGLPARALGVDILVVREGSEDIYAGFEHRGAEGVFETVRVTTRAACERIHRYAFTEAARLGRARVTTVHKANILKKADGMFLAVGREVAREFGGIAHDDVIVDALCMQLVRRPQRFDVLVCGNLFGDIVSDCAAGVAGGLTVATGVSLGPGVVVMENPHGAAEHEVTPGGASPYPALMMGVELLTRLGEIGLAQRLRGGVVAALTAGVHTADMGGSAGTGDVVRAVVEGA